MKRFILLGIFLLILGGLSAQEISGNAYYFSKTTMDMNNFGNREMSENMKKMIAERMKSMLEKNYILTFTAKESLYKEEEKLEAGAGGGFRMMMAGFSAGPQYKNLNTGDYLTEQEFFGKQFLISDSIPELEWTLENESKQIGQYIAFKATAVKKVEDLGFSFGRGRRNAEQNEAKADSTKTDDESAIEIPSEIVVTAWYTPQIPVKNGPGEYGGLPGLILELNAYRTTILCHKIELQTKKAITIEPLKKGKAVSREEYNTIVREKTKEMRENFRRGGGRRQIRIGG